MLAAGDFSGFGFSDSINNHTINCHYLLHFDGGQLTHVILYKGLLSVVVVVFTTQDVVDETELQSTKPGHTPSSSSSTHYCSVARLKALVEERRRSPAYRQMLTERQRLPVYQHRDDIVDAFRRHNVFIVAGETGSGKSTQVPRFILEVNPSTYY